MHKIKAGYQITIQSHNTTFKGMQAVKAGRGLYKATNSKDGLSEVEAKFYVDMFKILADKKHSGKIDMVGVAIYKTSNVNYTNFIDDCLIVLRNPKYAEYLKNKFSQEKSIIENIEPDNVPYILDNVFEGWFNDEFYFSNRYITNISVSYVPEEIILEDVTLQFLK